MSRTRPIHAAFFTLLLALLAPHARAAMDRAPEILEHRQVANTVELMWSPGGDADGTLDEDVVSYSIQRKGYEIGSWTTLATSADENGVTFTDTIVDSAAWTNHKGDSIRYRVVANTTGGTTHSQEAVFVPSLPLWMSESKDGKARLVWTASPVPIGYPTFVGYRIQKYDGSNWNDLTGGFTVTDLTWTDPNTTTGTSLYRVQSRHQQAPPQSGTSTRTSNEVEITINVMCDGQETNPAVPALHVIEIVDSEPDSDYDGDDVVDALEDCADEVYEDLSGPGDNDGIWEAGETKITGGCILRALPVTYDDVAIRITNRTQCDASPTYPLDCLALDFPAGLVIEGHGRESVFRSPLWQDVASPVPYPAPVLEIHRRNFQVTIRNLVLDGRKFEQEPPGTGAWYGWWYGGLYVWNTGPWVDDVQEISGDNIGDDDGYCDFERCNEAATGNDGDGKCEPGESCVEHPDDTAIDPDGVCSTDVWANAPGCESAGDSDDGCLHNVEVRGIPGAHAVLIDHANRWIIEDNDIHDVGCVNRGFGYDCPLFSAAADAAVPEGFKTFGIGLNVNAYTADFQVRRNTVQRVTKYALCFDNAKNTCNGVLRNHEVSENDVRDIGAVGIFNHGTVGARIHDNTIENTTTWDDPPAENGNLGPFGMSLGGYCSDDNEFYDNDILDSGGIGILWNGSSDTMVCSSPGTCALATPVGNKIYGNVLDGVCTERDTTVAASPTFGYGSIISHLDSAGTLLLEDNELTDSRCRHSIQALGPRDAFVGPFELRVAGTSGIGSSYESGPNVTTRAVGGFYCGAVHVYGPNRKLVIEDGDHNSFVNADDATPKVDVPMACAGHGATLVVDDTPNPYDADFTAPEDVGSSYGPTTVVQCSVTSHPDCD